MEALIAIGPAVLAGAVLQSATGFGFALVCAPVVFATLDPEPAIWLITLLTIVVNLLTLTTERRRPAPLRRDAAGLLAWSVPGALAGVAILRALDELLLQALVTVAVLASLAVRLRAARRAVAAGPTPAWAQPLAGVTMGALNTSTGTGGPPLVLYLLARGAPPERMRDTLGLVFLAGALIGAGVLAVTGTGPLPEAGVALGALPLAVAGQVAGRSVFARLAEGGYEVTLALVLAASAAGGLLQALG